MTELIYLDIDGTLRDEREGIPQSAVWAVEQCREQKIKIVICTGRNLGMVQDDVRALQTDGIISGGGCYIQYHGKEIWRKQFSLEALKKALKLGADWQLSLAVETEQEVYMDQGAAEFYREDFQHKIGRQERGSREGLYLKNKISYEDNLGRLGRDACKVHKICVLVGKEPIDQMERALWKESCLAQKREWNGRWYLELLPRGCDKGKAVCRLNRELGVLKQNTMSFGDGENDIAMMEATGIAVAVGEGNAVVRRHAASVCEPVMQDGIYRELVRRKVIRAFGERSSFVGT